MAPAHYLGRQPEYTTMSRRPGIASFWYDKYGNTDVFPRDYTVLNGKQGKSPKFYDRKYELTNPEEYAILKTMRKAKAISNANNTPERLLAREICLKHNSERLERSFETHGE